MWSTNAPTEPGYYWLRGREDQPEIMQCDGAGWFYDVGSDLMFSAQELQGEWQPVAPPIEQAALPGNGTRIYICGGIAKSIKNSGLPPEQIEIMLSNLYAAFDLYWPSAD